MAILGAIAFFGYSPFLKTVVQQFGSPVGTTLNTQKQASIIFALTATSTSILNPFGQTVYVLGPQIACNNVGSSRTLVTGTGIASLTLLIGTSSVSDVNQAATSSAAEVGNLTIATSTPNFLLASSTMQTATSSYATVWGATEYMTFQANATNTAICTAGVAVLQQ